MACQSLSGLKKAFAGGKEKGQLQQGEIEYTELE